MAALVLLTGCSDARLFHRPESLSESYVDCACNEAVYRLGCPDVLEVRFAEHPEWDSVASIDLDGALPLGPAGRAVVSGLSLDQARERVAKAARVEPEDVSLRVLDTRSGRIYLSGPENNLQRVFPYRGPEPVIDFLWRVGAIKQGCSDLHDLSIVRPNVAAGQRPLTLIVDYEAVILDGDGTTNYLLQASDQVVLGETRRSEISRRLPAWLRPLYRKLVGLLPPDGWPWDF